MSVKLIESQNEEGIRGRLAKNRQLRRKARLHGATRVIFAPLQYPHTKLPSIMAKTETPDALEDSTSDGSSARYSKRFPRIPKRNSQTIRVSQGKLKKMMADQAIEKRMHSLGYANYLSPRKRRPPFNSNESARLKLKGLLEVHKKGDEALDASLAKLRLSSIQPAIEINFKKIRQKEIIESKILFEKLKNPNKDDLPLKKKLNRALVGPREILSVRPRERTPPKYWSPKRKPKQLPPIVEN
ncbi:hypothetical protein HDV01_000079 [Terramyces sp. JEL0728]|nr:hypothetical protein HDV01_000079 [Terramyces sp. JEL0728]